jgi:LysM domain
MTNTSSAALLLPGGPSLPVRPHLRLVDAEERVRPARPVRPRVSPAVRRRRSLLACMAAALVVLALPLSGTGGRSHATGSALAGAGRPSTYTVQPGDTLWSIASRVDPSGDPRPLVSRLAAQVGSDTVVPGEHLVLP